MTIEANKAYFGPHDERRMVTSVENGTVTYHGRLTQVSHQMPLAEFEAWAAQSDLRIYYPEDFSERRVVMEKDDEKVRYYLEKSREIVECPRAEWDEWRAELPDAAKPSAPMQPNKAALRGK